MERDILEGRVEGRRARGRPRSRWEELKNNITETLSIAMYQAGRLAQNLNLFRRTVMAATSENG